MDAYDMMFSDAARKPTSVSHTQKATKTNGSLLSRKIWLPKALYAALPYFYLVTGVSALLATLYIGHWIWILPHYLLFSAACLHMAVLIFRRRHQADKHAD